MFTLTKDCSPAELAAALRSMSETLVVAADRLTQTGATPKPPEGNPLTGAGYETPYVITITKPGVTTLRVVEHSGAVISRKVWPSLPAARAAWAALPNHKDAKEKVLKDGYQVSFDEFNPGAHNRIPTRFITKKAAGQPVAA